VQQAYEGLAPGPEYKRIATEIKRGIAAMDGPVVIWADKHKVG
jgi:hypothetical protein